MIFSPSVTLLLSSSVNMERLERGGQGRGQERRADLKDKDESLLNISFTIHVRTIRKHQETPRDKSRRLTLDNGISASASIRPND